MAGEINCAANSLDPVGKSDCASILGRLRKWAVAPTTWEMTIANIATQSNFQTEIQKAAGARTLIMPLIHSYDDNSTEDTFEENPYTVIKTADGRYDITINMRVNQVQMNALDSYNGQRVAFIGVDANDNAHFVIKDDLTVNAAIATLYVLNRTWATDDTSGKARIRVVFENKNDFNKNGKLLNLDYWDLLSPLTPHVIEQVSASATELVVTVKNKNDQQGKAGLVIGDFSITGTGTLDSLVDDGNGQYTITTTGLINGDIVDLVATTAISVDGVISDGPLTVSI